MPYMVSFQKLHGTVAEDIAQLEEYLPGTLKVLGLLSTAT